VPGTDYTGCDSDAIIYTDKSFKDAALALNMKSESGSFRISGQFRAI